MDLTVSAAHDGCSPAAEAVSISSAMQSPLQALNSMACSVPGPPPSVGEEATNRIDSKSPPLTIAHQEGEATTPTINSSSNINSCQNSSSNSPPSYKDSNNCNNKSNSRPNSRNSNNNDRRAGEENSSDGGNYESSASFKLTGSQKRPREEEDFPSNGSVDEPMPSRQKLSSGSPVHHSNGLTNGNTNGDQKEYDDNNSLAAGEESTKENKMVEGCDSLSKNGKICLGDDALLETGDALKDLSPEQIAKRKELVNRLQVQLRTEEMKLVLLKKLKQSQQMVESNSVGGTDTKSALTKLPANTTAIKLPPTPTSNKSDSKPQPNSKSSNGNSSRTTNGTTKTPSVSPSLSPTALQAQRHLLARGTTLTSTMGNSNSSSKPGSPSVSAANLSSTGLPASLNLPFNLSREVEIIRKDSPSASPRDSPSLNAKGTGSSTSSNASRSTPDESGGLVGGQTPAQRQAAARLALRKQLEKTLLKITPPKPPPPEMHFIPNPNNQEFLYLVGLEMSVDRLLQGSKVLPPEPQPTPFICSQCGTDFTPAWKWEAQPLITEGMSANEVRVVCDACVTNNIKNGLKQEQTNRLKAAFMKALQQEQEIEQRLAAQSTWDSEVRRQQFHQQSRGSKQKHRPELSLEKVSGVEAMTRGNSDLTVTATGGGSGSVSPSVRSPTVSVTAVKERSHASPSQGRGSSRHHHELMLQQQRKEHERDRQIRERERQTRERELEREREREREREFRAEKERRDREQREKDSMMFPPGMTKQQKEQFLAMSTAAAMAQAMSNPAALQQMQAAQQQLLRMQGMGGSGASQQIPPHMLAPYLLSHYNPFNMQIQQLMAAQLGAAMQQQGTSGNSNAAAAAALSAAAAAALGAASGGGSSAGGGSSSSTGGGSSSGGSGSSSNSKAAANLARQEQLMRQATEMQRQYLLDMIPNAAGFQAAAVAAAAAAHQGTSSSGSGREGSSSRGDKYKS